MDKLSEREITKVSHEEIENLNSTVYIFKIE